MQGRVIHNTSPEWIQIKDAAERARDVASSEGDETASMTCSELLDALDLSRCLFFMGYDPNYGLNTIQSHNVTMYIIFLPIYFILA